MMGLKLIHVSKRDTRRAMGKLIKCYGVTISISMKMCRVKTGIVCVCVWRWPYWRGYAVDLVAIYLNYRMSVLCQAISGAPQRTDERLVFKTKIMSWRQNNTPLLLDFPEAVIPFIRHWEMLFPEGNRAIVFEARQLWSHATTPTLFGLSLQPILVITHSHIMQYCIWYYRDEHTTYKRICGHKNDVSNLEILDCVIARVRIIIINNSYAILNEKELSGPHFY